MTTNTQGNSPQMAYFRLAQLKGVCNLESKGLKGRIGPIRPRIAAEFGLKPRAPYGDFIAAIETKMQQLLAEKESDKQTQ